MILSNTNILDTISYICSKENSFNKLKKDFSDIGDDLIEYKKNRKNSRTIFNYFHEKLMAEPKIINKYIENFGEFAEKINSIKELKQKQIVDKLIKDINENNINFIISILIKNEESFSNLIKENYKIKSDLISYKKDSNYEHRERIAKYFLNLLEKDNQYLTKYINENYENILLEIKNIERETEKANNLSGRSFTIDNNEKSWSYFTRQVANKTFRSFSVVENKDKLEIYFL